MALPAGKYDAPVVLWHCIRTNRDDTNASVYVRFLVDPGDGGAAEEIAADVWLFKRDDEGNPGAELNPRSVQALACLGWDRDDIEALNLDDGQDPLLVGDGAQIDVQHEEWTPTNDDGTPKVDEYGQPVVRTSVKVAWINRLGAGPVEAADDEQIGRFGSKFRSQLGGVREALGSRGKVKQGVRPRKEKPAEKAPESQVGGAVESGDSEETAGAMPF